MKLATLKNGTRDGQLVIVSRDLQRMTAPLASVTTVQQALDRWPEVQVDLQARYEALNARMDAERPSTHPLRRSAAHAPISGWTPPPTSTMSR